MDHLKSSRYLGWLDLPGGPNQRLFSDCCSVLVLLHSLEKMRLNLIPVFLNLSRVLYIKKVMELPGWQLGARRQRTSLEASVFSCVKLLSSAAINSNAVSCQRRTGDSARRLGDWTQHLLVRAASPSAVLSRPFVLLLSVIPLVHSAQTSGNCHHYYHLLLPSS